jgi:hypothetical protein
VLDAIQLKYTTGSVSAAFVAKPPNRHNWICCTINRCVGALVVLYIWELNILALLLSFHLTNKSNLYKTEFHWLKYLDKHAAVSTS